MCCSDLCPSPLYWLFFQRHLILHRRLTQTLETHINNTSALLHLSKRNTSHYWDVACRCSLFGSAANQYLKMYRCKACGPRMFSIPKMNHKVCLLNIWTLQSSERLVGYLSGLLLWGCIRQQLFDAVSVVLLTRDEHERSIKEGKCYWLK